MPGFALLYYSPYFYIKMIPLHIDHKSEFFKLYRIPNALYYKCLIKKSNIIYSYANTYFSIYSSKLIHITINSLKNILFQSTSQKVYSRSLSALASADISSSSTAFSPSSVAFNGLSSSSLSPPAITAGLSSSSLSSPVMTAGLSFNSF